MKRCIMGSENPVFLVLFCCLYLFNPLFCRSVTLNLCRIPSVTLVVVLVNVKLQVNSRVVQQSPSRNTDKQCRKPVHRPYGGRESDVGAGSSLGSCNETLLCQRVATTTPSSRISLCLPSFIPPRCGLASAVCLSVCLSVTPSWGWSLCSPLLSVNKPIHQLEKME